MFQSQLNTYNTGQRRAFNTCFLIEVLQTLYIYIVELQTTNKADQRFTENTSEKSLLAINISS